MTIPTIRERSPSIPSARVSLFFRTVSPRITVHRTPPSLCLWPKPRKGGPRSKGSKHLPEEKDNQAARLVLQNPLSLSWDFTALKENHLQGERCCPRTPGAQIKADHPHRTPLAHRGDGPPAGPSGACGPRAVSSQLTRLAGPGALSLDLILPGVELGFSLAAQMFRQ